MEENKSQLRKKYRQIRKNLLNKALLDTLVVENFLSSFSLADYKSIGLYLPIDGEIDPTVLLSKLDDKILCLPCLSEMEGMFFRRWREEDKLEQHSKLKISYPATGKAINPELIFVPLVAFNQDCYRLGFGKGFFDNFISTSRSENRNTVYIGLGYDEQLCQSLITETHDQPLDFVITQTTLYKRR